MPRTARDSAGGAWKAPYADAVGENDEADAADRVASEVWLRSWAKKAADRIPTGWIITSVGAILLGATAAFGGLAPAPQPKPVELSAGERYTGSMLDMAVISAGVGGDIDGTIVDPEQGQRTLIVVLDVTNQFTAPRLARSKDTMGGVGIEGVKLDGVDVTRTIDGSSVLEFQPGVPTRVRLAWLIDGDQVRAGDRIRVALPDSTHYVGSFVQRGDYFSDVRTGAYATVRVEELPEEEAP